MLMKTKRFLDWQKRPRSADLQLKDAVAAATRRVSFNFLPLHERQESEWCGPSIALPFCCDVLALRHHVTLVELLISHLDRPALAALVLQEAEDSCSRYAEHDYVAWFAVGSYILWGYSELYIPTTKLARPPASSTRPLTKLMKRSTISVANLRTNCAVDWTSWTAVVKKDQTSSTTEVTRSERALIMDDMLVSWLQLVY
jgi:hypothetical protein